MILIPDPLVTIYKIDKNTTILKGTITFVIFDFDNKNGGLIPPTYGVLPTASLYPAIGTIAKAFKFTSLVRIQLRH